MLSLLNDILASYMLPGLVLSLGLCFLFVHVPEREGLRGYRMARRMMGVAYLTFFVVLIVEQVGLQLAMPTMLQQMMMVAMGILQAFLFTYALTTLVDVRFFRWSRVVRELFSIVLPAMAAFAAYPFLGHHLWLFAFLAFFYGCKLMHYVILFRRRYADYKRRMAGYFSSDEWERLLWVAHSFYAALSVGILALLYALFPSTLTSLVFTTVMATYYIVFGIRFVNYAFAFRQIEAALSVDWTSPNAEEGFSQELLSYPPLCQSTDNQYVTLLQQLDELMEGGLYVQPNLTIEDVAVRVGASSRTVSAAINSTEGTNFKNWVNAYRVEAAKRLISEGYLADHTIEALAADSGFANRISFYRAFKKQTGQSPTAFG